MRPINPRVYSQILYDKRLSSGACKPQLGSPCNGCGFCCQQEVCELGILILGSTQAPCPLLHYEGGRTWCGAVMVNQPIQQKLMDALGIGKGCCSDDRAFL